VLTELRDEPLESLADEQLHDDLVELRRQMAALEAEWLRRVAEMDTRSSYETDGAVSAAAWLRWRCWEPPGAASRSVRMARALRHMPGAAVRFGDGDLNRPRVEALVEAHRRHPEVYRRDEQVLVEGATELGWRDFKLAMTYWRNAADDVEARRDAAAQHRRRRLHVSTTWGGMVRIDGDLDPVGGEVVLTALRALTDPALRDATDERTPAQMRADALMDLCQDYLNRGEAPVTGGEKPHVNLLVDLEVLEGRAGRTCELDEAGVITGELARLIACDAGISRIITNERSEPLDVGRRTRTVPPAIRRALVARDGGCVVPGCDRPPRWCDAHHIIHWIDGGPTALFNLLLLCRRHHRMIHEGKIQLPPRAPP
jgi:hypothetical protein